MGWEAGRIGINMGHIKGINLNERNGAWRGDKVSYKSLHTWVRRKLIEPDYCPCCGNHKKNYLDIANISGEYKRDLSDWKWMCRKCHMEEDGRLRRLNELPKNPPILTKEIIEKIRLALRKGKYVNCSLCNKEFYKKPSHITINNYCSKNCYMVILKNRNKKGKLLC
jgi:hypothetical protein